VSLQKLHCHRGIQFLMVSLRRNADAVAISHHRSKVYEQARLRHLSWQTPRGQVLRVRFSRILQKGRHPFLYIS
jgi:hypothetical protein